MPVLRPARASTPRPEAQRSCPSPRLTRSVAVAAVVLLLAAPSTPQGQQPETPQQPPVFRTGTNLIRVDVTVIDGRGEPVTTLTADDFEVRDDGQPQTITSFKLVEASGEPSDEASLPIRNVQHAAAEAAKDDVRVFLVFWDDYHIAPFVNALRARQDLERSVLDAFGPTDLVAIMDPLTTLDSIRFTRDRRALANQAHALQGRRGVYLPPRSGIEDEHLMNMRRIEQIRCQVTESAVKAAAAHMGTLREGPNALIVISEGFGPCGEPSDESQRLRDLIRVASGSHTAIFVADPRGLQIRGRMSSFLQSLAMGTGGEALQTNDLSMIFTRAVKQASAFYLLGYAKDMPIDGKFHEIKVRVKRRGLEVRSRAGYWAPRGEDVAHAKRAAEEATVTPAVAEALSRLTPIGARRSVDVWTGTTPLPNGQTRVTIAWLPRATSANVLVAPVGIAVTATTPSGVVFQGPVPDDGTSFDAPPGPLQLVIATANGADEVIDRETRTLTISDAAAHALTLSSLVVYRARTLRESREAQLPVYAGREFDRTDRVLVRFDTHGPAREGAQVSARLLNRTGTPLTPLTVLPDAAGRGYLITLPLTSIARGEFLLSVEAVRGDDRADALVAFRVMR